MKMKLLTLLVAVGFVLSGEVAFPYEMEPIVVVASPIIEGNIVDRYGAEKTVVGEDQIEDLNAQDIGSALRRTPGVNISRYNMIGSFGGATGGAVFIRGLGSSRPGAEIKTFIDGAPMYMSIWNHPLLDLLSVDTARSIEVYKSPQPHMFGNALGIINIVPKSLETEGFVTKGAFGGGSHDTYIVKASHGGKMGRFDYYLGGGYRTSDGHRDDSDGELKDLYGKVGYQMNENWKGSVFVFGTDNYADDPGIEGKPASKLGRYETRALLTTANLENKYDWGHGIIKFYRSEGEGKWLNNPVSAGVLEDADYNFLFYGFKVREIFTLWEGGEIVAGLDWDYADGDYDKEFSNEKTDHWDGHDYTLVSPYIAVSHMWGNKDGFYVIPSVGLRYYEHSDFDAEVAPQGGVILGYKHVAFHAGYAKGILYPGLEVVVISEKQNTALGKSWENLGAEKVDHLEAGVSGNFFNNRISADITWFYNDGKNRYEIVLPPPPPPRYANVEKYRTKGVEANVSFRILENLSSFLGVTFLDAEPEDLPYAPDVTFVAGLNWAFLDHFKLTVDTEYVDTMYVGAQARRVGDVNTSRVNSYFLVNGKLSYSFVLLKEVKGEVYCAVENLTNEHYEYLPGYPMPGTTWMLGTMVRF